MYCFTTNELNVLVEISIAVIKAGLTWEIIFLQTSWSTLWRKFYPRFVRLSSYLFSSVRLKYPKINSNRIKRIDSKTLSNFKFILPKHVYISDRNNKQFGYICIKRASQVDFNFDTLMMMFTEYKISDSKIKTLVQI